jgi:multidrug resistance efflux pump
MKFKLFLLLLLTAKTYGFSIYPQTSGEINFIMPAGSEFKKGDILVKIDSKIMQLEVKYHQQLLKNYQQNYADKKLIFKQEQELFDRMVGSQRNLTEAKLEFEKAERELQSFETKLEIAKYKLGKYQIKAPFNGKVEKLINPRNATNLTNPQALMEVKKL